MNKILIITTLTMAALTTTACVGLLTKPLREKKCYGLTVCQKKPGQCKNDDPKGLYQMKTPAACKIDGGNT